MFQRKNYVLLGSKIVHIINDQQTKNVYYIRLLKKFHQLTQISIMGDDIIKNTYIKKRKDKKQNIFESNFSISGCLKHSTIVNFHHI